MFSRVNHQWSVSLKDGQSTTVSALEATVAWLNSSLIYHATEKKNSYTPASRLQSVSSWIWDQSAPLGNLPKVTHHSLKSVVYIKVGDLFLQNAMEIGH
jgi:hypothetical protein